MFRSRSWSLSAVVYKSLSLAYTRSAVEDKFLLRLRGLDAVVSPLTHWGLGTT